MMDSYREGEVRDISADMAVLTLGIVVKCLFGADLPREARDISRPMLAVLDAANERLNSVLRTSSWLPTTRNLREKRAIAELDAILQLLLRTRRAEKESRGDLLSVLLAAADEESGARIASDLEADPCSDMIQKGRTGGDQFATSAVADQQMNWWVTDTDRRKDGGVRPDRAQGAHEHEAKEHDLPLVR